MAPFFFFQIYDLCLFFCQNLQSMLILIFLGFFQNYLGYNHWTFSFRFFRFLGLKNQLSMAQKNIVILPNSKLGRFFIKNMLIHFFSQNSSKTKNQFSRREMIFVCNN